MRTNKELQAMPWKTPPVNLSHIEPLPGPKDDPPPPHKTPTDPPNSNVVQESSTQATPVVNTATATSKERREVLLHTVFTNVQSPDGSKEIKARILLDSGSQRSYVTNSLKSKLNLTPVKTETLNLNTFGDQRVIKQKCDLVEVSLKGTSGYHSISQFLPYVFRRSVPHCLPPLTFHSIPI